MARAPRRAARRARARAPALAAFFVAGGVLGQSETARAGGASPLPPPPETLTYTEPAEPKPLRAAAEIAAVLTVGFAWYATTAPTVKNWDPGYRWATFKTKLTLQDFGTDTNQFGTNFIGHPAGGTGYYLAARANRLSIPVSFGLAVAGSLVWELFGEVSEVVSMNDMIVTPLAGIAVGEATTQLGAYFDRQPPSAGNRALGAVFGPFESLNDRFDHLTPARSSGARDEWHRFRTEAAFTLARDDGRPHLWPEGRATLSSELVRLPGYDEAGDDALWFDDGNASSIEFSASAGAAGVTELAFTTKVVLAGAYYRSSRRDARGEKWGGNGLAGVTTGFVYSFHQYRREQLTSVDRLATVEPLGLLWTQRGWLGGLLATGSVEGGPDFGGVTPAAIGAFHGDTARLPPVQQQRGYYLALGGHLRARLAFESGPVFAAGELSLLGLRSARGPSEAPGTPLADELVRQELELGARAPGTAFTPRLFWERRRRLGWVSGQRGASGDSTLGAGLGATF